MLTASGFDEREHIRAAMDRIFAGTPQRSSGALTVVALAQEAGVPRNALTQRHLDLKNEFYARAKAYVRVPEFEKRLRSKITSLKETIENKNLELVQLRDDVEGLVGVVNQLVLENRLLRETLGRPESRLHVLPTQRHP